jgi:recombination DNA repair RAD52 pathway protein
VGNDFSSAKLDDFLTQPHSLGNRLLLEGHTSINLANKIFGFNGWSSEIKSMNTEMASI